MSDNDQAFEVRFASLEDAARNLSADVQALNATLLVVADLQKKQREQAIRTEKNELAITASTALAEERDRRTRTVVQMIAVAAGVLLPLVSILVYWALIDHVNDLLDQQAKDRYSSCMARNIATQENVNREHSLALVEKDDALSRLHEQSSQKLRQGLVVCKAGPR